MIRLVEKKDASAICDIYNVYIANSVVTFEEELINESEVHKRIEKIDSEKLPWLVAEDDKGNILGYAYASKWHDRYSYRFSVEITAYLANHHMSKGLGTQLYNVLFEQLKRKNIHSVIGCITLPNEASVRLHEKFSMTKVAHFKEVGLKFERWLDVGYWQGIL